MKNTFPPETKTLAALIEAMRGVPVLVAGDMMLDRFVYGQVDRISPESPVPVLTIQREKRMLGGAGNALANLAALGARAFMLGMAGADAEGELLRAEASALGIDAQGLVQTPHRPTTVKTRFLAGHQQLLRSDYEIALPAPDHVVAEILDRAGKIIPGVKAVILSDYGKGLLRPDVIAGVIGVAKVHGVPVFVDPKGMDYTIYRGARAITPNRKELEEGTRGLPTDTNADIEAAAAHLIATCGIGAVIATRSREGLSIIEPGCAPVHLPGAKIDVFDVSGAGDSVIATVAACVAAGGDLAQAGALANLAGSIVVTKVGTAPIHAQELLDALEEESAWPLCGLQGYQGDHAQSASKLAHLSWRAASEQAERWRARGLKVGFTNGCFDILHAGHVGYLQEARNRCDRLIVGLNTDYSVSVLKGPDRPVHDQESRARVLSALGCVDLVVLFGADMNAGQAGDNTAIALIENLKPDLYFKGGDYACVSAIPEAPTVHAYGGKVEIMRLLEGQSTTGAIQKIRGAA